MNAMASSATTRAIAVERAIADHTADAVVEIDAGRETHINADRSQLRRHEPAALPGEMPTGLRVEIVFATDRAHRRQHREALAKALHPAAFMVDRDQRRRRSRRAYVRNEALDLLDAFEVAREENDAADQRMPQQLAILLRENHALQIDHEGTESHERIGSLANCES